jgi:hypothetical protein
MIRRKRSTGFNLSSSIGSGSSQRVRCDER